MTRFQGSVGCAEFRVNLLKPLGHVSVERVTW
jgi:hypothetical protein